MTTQSKSVKLKFMRADIAQDSSVMYCSGCGLQYHFNVASACTEVGVRAKLELPTCCGGGGGGGGLCGVWDVGFVLPSFPTERMRQRETSHRYSPLSGHVSRLQLSLTCHDSKNAQWWEEIKRDAL